MGAGIRFYNLPSIPITDTCIPNFARANKAVKYAQGFFYGCVEVPAVTLVQVNVVGIEPFETRFDLPCQIRAGKAHTVRRDFIFHEPVTLGRDNESVSFALDNLSQGSLRGACGCCIGSAHAAAIYVGRIDQVAARGKEHVERRLRVVVIHSCTEEDCAQPKARNLQTGLSPDCNIP